MPLVGISAVMECRSKPDKIMQFVQWQGGSAADGIFNAWDEHRARQMQEENRRLAKEDRQMAIEDRAKRNELADLQLGEAQRKIQEAEYNRGVFAKAFGEKPTPDIFRQAAMIDPDKTQIATALAVAGMGQGGTAEDRKNRLLQNPDLAAAIAAGDQLPPTAMKAFPAGAPHERVSGQEHLAQWEKNTLNPAFAGANTEFLTSPEGMEWQRQSRVRAFHSALAGGGDREFHQLDNGDYGYVDNRGIFHKQGNAAALDEEKTHANSPWFREGAVFASDLSTSEIRSTAGWREEVALGFDDFIVNPRFEELLKDFPGGNGLYIAADLMDSHSDYFQTMLDAHRRGDPGVEQIWAQAVENMSKWRGRDLKAITQGFGTQVDKTLLDLPEFDDVAGRVWEGARELLVGEMSPEKLQTLIKHFRDVATLQRATGDKSVLKPINLFASELRGQRGFFDKRSDRDRAALARDVATYKFIDYLRQGGAGGYAKPTPKKGTALAGATLDKPNPEIPQGKVTQDGAGNNVLTLPPNHYFNPQDNNRMTVLSAALTQPAQPAQNSSAGTLSVAANADNGEEWKPTNRAAGWGIMEKVEPENNGGVSNDINATMSESTPGGMRTNLDSYTVGTPKEQAAVLDAVVNGKKVGRAYFDDFLPQYAANINRIGVDDDKEPESFDGLQYHPDGGLSIFARDSDSDVEFYIPASHISKGGKINWEASSDSIVAYITEGGKTRSVYIPDWNWEVNTKGGK